MEVNHRIKTFASRITGHQDNVIFHHYTATMGPNVNVIFIRGTIKDSNYALFTFDFSLVKDRGPKKDSLEMRSNISYQAESNDRLNT